MMLYYKCIVSGVIVGDRVLSASEPFEAPTLKKQRSTAAIPFVGRAFL